MPQPIEFEVFTDNETEAAAYIAYWQLADDGVTWKETVKAIRERYGLGQRDMVRIARECGLAICRDLVCVDCGTPHPLTSRSEYIRLLGTANELCDGCQEERRAEAVRIAQERAERRQTSLRQRFAIRTSDTSHLTREDLSLFQAVALLSLFTDPAVDQTGMTTPTRLWPKDRPWAHENIRVDLERQLAEAQPAVVFPHPESDQQAFVWEDDQATGSFYLGYAGYYLAGPGPVQERPRALLSDLIAAFRDGPWPTHWLEEWPTLWDRLVLADASTYLDMKLREHHLEMKQGDGTRAALEDALTTFSLGQVYSIIWRATRDAAAYYQRGGVNKRQAANSTVARINSSVARARAEKWTINPYRRPWNLPLTAIGEAFFTTAMWQADMVTTARRDAAPPPHAWDSQPSGEPSTDPDET